MIDSARRQVRQLAARALDLGCAGLIIKGHDRISISDIKGLADQGHAHR
jgi:hypothetical protein